jgi:hypothetical protein
MSASPPSFLHRIFDAIDALNYRVVYAVLALLLAAPFIIGHWSVKWRARQLTKGLYAAVERCGDTGKPVLLINGWIMDSRGENQPQFEVLVDHMMRRHVRFILLSLEPDTAIVGRSICLKTERYYNEKFGKDYVQYGRDWLDLGYQLIYAGGYWTIWIPNLKADGLVKTFMTDYQKRDLTCFPIMRRPGAPPLEQPGTPVDLSTLSPQQYKEQWLRLDDFGLILEVHFTYTIVDLIGLVRLDPDFRGPDGKPKIEMGEATVNMSINELLPYYDSGSLAGILAGYQGAAEYSDLLRRDYGWGPSVEEFHQRNNSYSLGVLWVLALIVIGNISTLRKVLRDRRLARGGNG